MIPKILHFVWLSGSALPADIQACLDSWKEYFPDYEIKYWTKADSDILKISYVAQAIEAKKWAFATDYIRLYVLYHFGGIYMDSDVLVRKNFNFVLQNRFFSAIESYPENIELSIKRGDIDIEGNRIKDVPYILGIQIQAAIMGAEKGHPFVKDCMEYYDNHVFLGKNGEPSMDMISPYIYANTAVKYGFKFKNEEQKILEGITLYSASMFASSTCQVCKNSYAVHCCKGSWREPSKNDASLFRTEDIPSETIVKLRLDGIIKASKLMDSYKYWFGCNDLILQRFLIYLAHYNIWQYRKYLFKLAFACGFDKAKNTYKIVCYYRGVHSNLYCRFKQNFLSLFRD